MKKKIAIIGYGYVGKAIAKALEDHHIIFIYDPYKYNWKFFEDHSIAYDEMKRGRKEKYDQSEYVQRESGIIGYKSEREKSLIVQSSEEVNQCDLAIICVPTPSMEDGSCDTSTVVETLEWVETPLVLIKSTMPPKDLEDLAATYKNIAFSPEYIGEGKYFVPFWRYPHPTNMKYHDFMIIGGPREITSKILDFFIPVLGPSCRFMQTDIKTAAMVKYMENAWGATKVTFCNEWSRIAEALGVDYKELRELFLLDGRTERIHTAVFPDKPGYSGKCFPKDIKAAIKFSKEAGYNPDLIEEVDKSNDRFRK